MLNVKYSDPKPETLKPESSGASKGKEKDISPIKFPSNTPPKHEEDVPLSRTIPRNAPVIRDLRDQIRGVTSPDPFNAGPVRERTNRVFSTRQSPQSHHDDTPRRPQEIWNLGQRPANNYGNQIYPWLHASENRANQETAHHSRNFIENQHTSRDEGTMTDHGPGATSREGGADHNETSFRQDNYY